MIIRTKIWNDLLDAKKGDVYLVSYISNQRRWRKIFKIITIVLSASGIFSAFKDLQIPTVISFFVIGVIQIIQSIENFIILSNKDFDELKILRLLYNEKRIDLEKIWIDLESNSISDESAKNQLFEIMEKSKKIEDIDSSINVKLIQKLDKKAEAATSNYSKKFITR